MMLAIHSQLLFSAPGGAEWLMILGVVILLFGGKKLPELARGLGKGVREFKDAKEGKEAQLELEEKAKSNLQ